MGLWEARGGHGGSWGRGGGGGGLDGCGCLHEFVLLTSMELEIDSMK